MFLCLQHNLKTKTKTKRNIGFSVGSTNCLLRCDNIQKVTVEWVVNSADAICLDLLFSGFLSQRRSKPVNSKMQEAFGLCHQ